jgi:toxin ParE1/3/4
VGYRVTFSPEAEADLADLEAYLAYRFYPGNAERFVARIAEACVALGHAPYRGSSREDLGTGVRVVGFERRASIYFRVTKDQIRIEGVFYRGELPRSFDEWE